MCNDAVITIPAKQLCLEKCPDWKCKLIRGPGSSYVYVVSNKKLQHIAKGHTAEGAWINALLYARKRMCGKVIFDSRLCKWKWTEQ